MSIRTALIIFARAPVPGETKTRLLPALGAAEAAAFYHCFLLDILRQARTVKADIFVAAAEPEHAPTLSDLAAARLPGATVIVQSGRDLGARMLNAFRTVFRLEYRAAVVLGTDVPSLPWRRVTDALSLASERDAVLGPCLDGGYYLIGMHAVIPPLFEGVEWGTPTVLVETLRRAQRLKLHIALLEPWYDVDTPADVEVLRSHLTAVHLAQDEIPCPDTWQYLFTHPEVG